MRTILLLLCVWVTRVSHSQTQLSCLSKTTNTDLVAYNTGHTYMYNIFCGDLNNDGKNDIISSGNNSTINVLLANSTGSYTSAGSFTASSAGGVITGADYNKDGNLDVAVCYSGVGIVDVLFGNGDGTLGSAQVYYSPYGKPSIKSADINHDTHMDLVLSTVSGSVSVMYGTSTGSFVTTSSIYVGNITTIYTEDLNNDGRQDVASINPNSNSISILFGQPNGTLAAAVNYTVGTYPTCIAINDLNNDGIKDLAVSNRDSYNISILLGTPSGTFSAITNYSIGGAGLALWSIVSGDFNGDTYQDIVTSDYSTGNVFVLNGNGTGTFNNNRTSYALNMNYMSMAYMNNDALPDVLFTTNSSGLVTILYGSSTNFNYPYSIVSGINANDMISGDFDKDSNLDLAIATTAHKVSILRGMGNGLFSPPVNYSVGINPVAIISEDFNNDTYMDIAVANSYSNSISVLLGNNTGTFSSAGTFTVGATGLCGLAAADINGDNIPDLAVVNSSASNIRYLLGNGNGTFSVSPAITWWAGLTPASIVSKDLNNDGLKDFVIAGNSSGSPGIAILYNNGNVSFGLGSMSNMGYYTTSAIAEDLNKDGNIDFASAAGNTTSIWKGGGWANYSIAATKLKTADIDHDGFLDVVACLPSRNKIAIIFEKPGVNNPVQVWAGNNPSAFTTGDFNNDGMDDIVTGNAGNWSISVLLNGLPKLAITGLDSICKGNSAALSATGASTYSWSSASAGASASVSPTVSTTYTLTGTTALGCSNTTSKSIKVNNLVLPAVIANSGTICAGDNFTITPSGATTYSYSGGSNVVSPSTTTYYTITGATGNGCNATSVSSVIVNSLPVITVNSGSICVGQTFTLSPSGANTYTFSSGGSTVSPLISAGYTVSGTNMDGCVGSGTSSVTVNLNPVLTVSSGSVCPGMTFTLTPSGALTYTYSSGSGTVTPLVNSTYTITGTGANGCKGTATSTVIINTTVPTITVNDGTICSNQTFTIIPSGANTYTYSSSSNTVTPLVTSSYTVTGTDINGCVNSVGAISTVSVNAVPSLTTTQNVNVCVGTSTLLTVSGANTYMWSTNETTSSITVTPTLSTTYTLTGRDLNNCSSTQTVSLNVNQMCQDVWPGDANSDGTADNLDVLELGLHYTQTGPARATTSNNWQSYFSNNWTGNLSNGKNVNHSDCNGDGVMDANDTLAIYTNYGLTHAFKPTQQTVSNPQLSIVPDQAFVNKGDWGTASVFLGDVSNPETNVNGIAFTVDFDYTLLESNSVWIEYPLSFINNGQNLHFRKEDFQNGKLYTATTHTSSANVNGQGKIATLHYRIKSALVTDDVFNIGISQAYKSDASGVINPITSGTASVIAVGASVGVNELAGGNYISVYPNPAVNEVMISSGIPMNKLEITSVTGQALLKVDMDAKIYSLNTSEFSNGIYFIRIFSNGIQTAYKKLVIQK